MPKASLDIRTQRDSRVRNAVLPSVPIRTRDRISMLIFRKIAVPN